MTQLYSDTVPAQFQATIRRITARPESGDTFCSHAYIQDNSHDETGTAPLREAVWLSAEKDDGRDTWTVWEHRTSDIEGLLQGRNVKTSIAPYENNIGLCVFDAIHLAAEFDRDQDNIKNQAIKSDNNHVRDFAEKEGLPFDDTTALPIPVANGKILPTSAFDLPENAQEIMERAKGNLAHTNSILTQSVAHILADSTLSSALAADEEQTRSALRTAMTKTYENVELVKRTKQEIEEKHTNTYACDKLKEKSLDTNPEITIRTSNGFQASVFAGAFSTSWGVISYVASQSSDPDGWVAVALLSIMAGVAGIGSAISGITEAKNSKPAKKLANFTKQEEKLRTEFQKVANPDIRETLNNLVDKAKTDFIRLQMRTNFIKGKNEALDAWTETMRTHCQSLGLSRPETNALMLIVRKDQAIEGSDSVIIELQTDIRESFNLMVRLLEQDREEILQQRLAAANDDQKQIEAPKKPATIADLGIPLFP